MKRFAMQLFIFLAVLACIAGLVVALTPYEAAVGYTFGSPVADEELQAYDGIDSVKAAFQADAGHPRLILLAAPT